MWAETGSFELTKEMFLTEMGGNQTEQASRMFFERVFKQLKNLKVFAHVDKRHSTLQLGVKVSCVVNDIERHVFRLAPSIDAEMMWNWQALADILVQVISHALVKELFLDKTYFENLRQWAKEQEQESPAPSPES
jgi:hypothetical protein